MQFLCLIKTAHINTYKIMATITDISQLNPEGIYTYANYLTWRFEQTVELINGKIWRMSPAPKTNHQRIARNLNGIFYNCSIKRNREKPTKIFLRWCSPICALFAIKKKLTNAVAWERPIWLWKFSQEEIQEKKCA